MAIERKTRVQAWVKRSTKKKLQSIAKKEQLPLSIYINQVLTKHVRK